MQPVICNQSRDITVLKGHHVVLETFFFGCPESEVVWRRADRSIEDTNISIINKQGYSALFIRKISANQSGKYTTHVMNQFGTSMAVTSVAVKGPPEPPSGKPSIFCGSDWIRLAWCSPPYDGGGIIIGFILEMQCGDNEWTTIAETLETPSYTIENLSQHQRYRFRIRAQNRYGLSEPSTTHNILLTSPKAKIQNDSGDQKLELLSGNEFKLRYDLLEELGRGRFGVVHKVCNISTGHIYAAKIMKCIKNNSKKKIREEIDIMCKLRHPKLLNLLECFESARETILIVEFISGGELFERVVADDFTLTEQDCVEFIRQICEAVQYMHNEYIVHLDLKPENIMCSTRDSHQIKIIDFGLAQSLNQDTSIRVLLGTPEFVAPEIINYEPIGFQTDMWSIGVICYVLLSGLSPFMGENDADTFNNITRAEYDFDEDSFDIVSEEAKDFIIGLLQHRKENRLTASQCLQTKWLSLDCSILGKSKICTHKLKKFIIRRKWQKTGNAIRALGRMASLSATRRGSFEKYSGVSEKESSS